MNNNPNYVDSAIRDTHTSNHALPAQLPFATVNDLKNWILDLFCASFNGYTRIGSYIFTTKNPLLISADINRMFQADKWLNTLPIPVGNRYVAFSSPVLNDIRLIEVDFANVGIQIAHVFPNPF